MRPSSSCLKALDILFLGSDTFSLGSFNALLRREDLWDTLQVVTPASKSIGRKNKPELYEASLARAATGAGIPTTPVQYSSFKQWMPPPPFNILSPSHVLITASFGAILPASALDLFPAHHKLNVHPSLLPRYRGASPIQYALMNRDATTGVTVQELSDKGADTGAIFAQRNFDIPPGSTYNSLVEPLAEIGGELLVETLEAIAEGRAQPTAQGATGVVKAPKIRKERSLIDFDTQSAAKIEALHRAMGHHLALRTSLPTDPPLGLILHDIAYSPVSLPHPPGSCSFDKTLGALLIACGDGSDGSAEKGGHLLVREVQIETKKRVDALTAWRGMRDRGLVGEDGRVRLGARGEV